MTRKRVLYERLHAAESRAERLRAALHALIAAADSDTGTTDGDWLAAEEALMRSFG